MDGKSAIVVVVNNKQECRVILKHTKDIWLDPLGHIDESSEFGFLQTHYLTNNDFPVELLFTSSTIGFLHSEDYYKAKKYRRVCTHQFTKMINS